MSTRIYTKTGDDGTTGLFGGQRVSKDSARINAYGSIDELNSVIGLALAFDPPSRLLTPITRISKILFELGADLATPLEPAPRYAVPRIGAEHSAFLENYIDEYETELPPLRHFILPGGTKPAAFLHQARTICRRAERHIVELARQENIGEHVLVFVNRLSDFLFVAARMANFLEKIPDAQWEPNEKG